MNAAMDTSKGPRVYVPPPLLYVLFFLLANFLQKRFPLPTALFEVIIIKILGGLLTLIALLLLFRSLRQFFITKNTVVLIKPARSLQTTGIYQLTRNPMYLGLVIAYLAVTSFWGNWWHIILLPILVLIVQEYVIKSEERYLEAEFGAVYNAYRTKVRRWF